MNLNEPLGVRIHRLRKERGLSLLKLQAICGVSAGHISSIELGKRYPGKDTLLLIASGLGIESSVLLEVFNQQSRRGWDWQDRFWDQVEKTETCWLWRGRKSKSGYGMFSIKRKELRAHRVAYVIENGDIPDGAVVHHTCNTRLCVRPDHLELVGSQETHLLMPGNDLLKSMGLIE